MALVFDGTTCLLCGCSIERDDAIAFPAFLPVGHALAMFSDSAFHVVCFERDPRSADVVALYERFREIWESRPEGLENVEEIEAWGKDAFKDFP